MKTSCEKYDDQIRTKDPLSEIPTSSKVEETYEDVRKNARIREPLEETSMDRSALSNSVSEAATERKFDALKRAMPISRMCSPSPVLAHQAQAAPLLHLSVEERASISF
jgi:hypothetical protein